MPEDRRIDVSAGELTDGVAFPIHVLAAEPGRDPVILPGAMVQITRSG